MSIRATEMFRPRYHFTPRENWMNDPNGLVYYQGEYHLFYQHNPQAPTWGHMSWGHAVSGDLVHWEHLPLAIPESADGAYTIFSGSAVVDWQNSSGFGEGDEPALVAVYTADNRPQKWVQNIHIAYSNDRGRTFTEYAGNPVLDFGHRKFGDPKVFWHAESNQWVMVAIRGWEQGCVVFWVSDDLKSWRYASVFRDDRALTGKWECPDLFLLAVEDEQLAKWVLKVNGPGPAATYWVGSFDGEAFVAESDAQLFDYGCAYAQVTYNEAPEGRRILVDWIRQGAVEGRPWSGAMTVPREVSLRAAQQGWRIALVPVAEVDELRGAHTVMEGVSVDGALDLAMSDNPANCHELVLALQLAEGAACGLALQLLGGAVARIGYRAEDARLYLELPEQTFDASLSLSEGHLCLRVLLDEDLIEVYGGEGEAVLTGCLAFGSVVERVTLEAEGAVRLARGDFWRLEP